MTVSEGMVPGVQGVEGTPDAPDAPDAPGPPGAEGLEGVTRALTELAASDEQALARLFRLVYDRLRDMARRAHVFGVCAPLRAWLIREMST